MVMWFLVFTSFGRYWGWRGGGAAAEKDMRDCQGKRKCLTRRGNSNSPWLTSSCWIQSILKSTELQFLLYPPSLVLCVLENAKILCCWFRPNASKFAHISNQSERHRLSVWTRILTFWAGVPLSSRHWMNGSFRCIMAQDEYNRYSEHDPAAL